MADEKKKLSLDEAAEMLTDTVEPRLAVLPPEERERRIKAFEKTISGSNESRSKSRDSEHTPAYPVEARDRSE